ncbi:MAG: ATP phosphoribosyltransferase regulatory subunit, partial [Phycisphaerae bacterium]
REFAIRPEMTPTLARMAAAQANSLPRPIKWFSMPRLCRAERPQRGRLREFFQWNIDILGDDSVLADAECIFVAADFFKETGLGPEHFVIKINSRALLAAVLENARLDPARFDAVYAVLDKRDKVDARTFEEMVGELKLPRPLGDTLLTLGEARGPEGMKSVRSMVAGHAVGEGCYTDLERLFELLDAMDVGDCCRFDMGVVRGLAYYTGIVFEAFGKGQLRRAICGGGRYDRLLSDVGGPPMSGTGFATSDVVIEDLLSELNKIPTIQSAIELFVIDADPEFFDQVVSLTARLRRRDHAVAFSYKRQSIGKQLRQAAGKNARRVIIVDAKTRSQETVGLKDLATGTQKDVTVASLLDDPFQPMA